MYHGILYWTITSIIAFTLIWDSWILHLYVRGKYAYLPLILFFLMEYFYHKNVISRTSRWWHRSLPTWVHSPLQFPSQESHLTTIYRQDIIVKTPRTQWWVWGIPHPGPQRDGGNHNRRQEKQLTPQAHPLPRLEMSHRKSPSELTACPLERETSWEYPVSELCRTLSGKASWVLPQVDHWGSRRLKAWVSGRDGK